MNTYIETDCTFTASNGNEYTLNGAYITPDRAVVYMPTSKNHPRIGMVTDWHGKELGPYVVKSMSKRHNCWGEYTFFVDVTIDGVRYHGRTQGSGMIVHLKAYTHQP